MHAVMGDGEIVICGAETPGEVRLTPQVVDVPDLPTPFIENDEIVAVICSAETTDEAFKMAVHRMHDFLTKVAGLTVNDAALLMSLTGDLKFCQVVDPLLTVRFEFPKRVLARSTASRWCARGPNRRSLPDEPHPAGPGRSLAPVRGHEFGVEAGRERDEGGIVEGDSLGMRDARGVDEQLFVDGRDEQVRVCEESNRPLDLLWCDPPAHQGVDEFQVQVGGCEQGGIVAFVLPEQLNRDVGPVFSSVEPLERDRAVDDYRRAGCHMKRPTHLRVRGRA
jgi:hypothetical protein